MPVIHYELCDEMIKDLSILAAARKILMMCFCANMVGNMSSRILHEVRKAPSI